MDERFGDRASSAALAGGFVENDGSGGGDVERADAAGHGNAQQMVAGAADEIVQTGALAAEDEDEIAGEVELVVVGCAAFVETDDPEIVALEIFEGADEVDDAGDAQMLGGAGAGLDGDGAQRGGAALGEDDAVDAGAIGDAQKSAEILRIFNAIESEQEASGRGLLPDRARRDLRWREIPAGERARRRPDGRGSWRRAVNCSRDSWRTRTPASRHWATRRSRRSILALAGDQNVIEAAAAGLESFLNRMQAVENFHMKIVVGNSRPIADCTSRPTSCQVIEL